MRLSQSEFGFSQLSARKQPGSGEKIIVRGHKITSRLFFLGGSSGEKKDTK